MDMLLDTMCNTFGGVCFIALMVAIMSATCPKGSVDESDGVVSAQMLQDKEKERLARRRDVLKSAIDVQKSFLASNCMSGVCMSEAELMRGLSSNETAIARLRSCDGSRTGPAAYFLHPSVPAPAEG